MRSLLAAAVVVLLPAAASAQLEVAARTATSAAAPTPRAAQRLFSLRLALGAAAALDRQSGSSFAWGVSTGAHWIIPSRGDRAWLLAVDVGVDRTAGFTDRGATHLAAGLTPGFTWGTWGLAWAPRAVLALTDSGDPAWGVRNGVRLILIAGVIDLELAHQYLAGPAVVNHQVFVTLGLDPGLVVHALAQHRGRW